MDNKNELVLIELKRVHLSESNQTTFCFLQTQLLFNVLQWHDDNNVSVLIRLKPGCITKMKTLWLKRSRIFKNVQKKDRWTTKQPRFDWIKTRSFVSINFQILVLWSDNSIDPTELKTGFNRIKTSYVICDVCSKFRVERNTNKVVRKWTKQTRFNWIKTSFMTCFGCSCFHVERKTIEFVR